MMYQTKGQYSKFIKNLSNSTSKKQKNPVKKWTEDMNRPKKTSKWPTDTWKRAPHHSASGKYKSKPQWDTTLHQSKRLKLTSQETTDVGEDVEKGESSYTVGGNATLENSMEAPQKVKNVTTQRLSNCPIRCLSKVHKVIWRGKSTQMFIVKLLKEPRCPSTDEWIKKMWYTYTHTHTHTHTHITQPSKRTKSCHLQGHGWN